MIIYDAAYEAYISEEDVPHSIYECEGARTCAIELRSFSKNAGFTGVRLGFTVVPKELVRDGVEIHSLWARRHGTKFNGAPYIVQRAGEAVYSPEGKAQLKEQVGYYMSNAKAIYEGLEEKIKSIIGTKVSIHRGAKHKGKIEIEYYSQEELERIMDLFESIQ